MAQPKNEPIFYNKDGTLTEYALSCGYVQKEKKGDNYKKLYQEHSTYHVIHMSGPIRQSWESFDLDDLKKARDHFNSIQL